MIPQGGVRQAGPFGHPPAHHHLNNAPKSSRWKLDRHHSATYEPGAPTPPGGAIWK
jgi:hypothetical protein